MSQRLTVVGAGYVGLACSACFARLGNYVTCVDGDAEKIASLQAGRIGIYEPGLDETVAQETEAGRLTFRVDARSAVGDADVVFVAVGTPPDPTTGTPDLSAVLAVADAVADTADGFIVLSVMSTVPVGTIRRLEARIAGRRYGADIAVVSNPAFVRQGKAIGDFLDADRIVVGSRDKRALALMETLYAPLTMRGSQFIATTPETSELAKLASNAFLSAKISFVNEMARLCEKLGADADTVGKAMGLDTRVLPDVLKPGPGIGGSGLPKDALSLARTARDAGSPLSIVETALASDRWHRQAMVAKISEVAGGLDGKRIGALGLAYKGGTGDVREAPALSILSELVGGGADVTAYDPQAMDNARAVLNGIDYAEDALGVAADADAVVILTEWPEFGDLDFGALRARMRRPQLIDFRNMVAPDAARAAGLVLYALGKAPRA